jgi:hypothetical protein
MGDRLIVVHAIADLKSYVSYPGARGTAPGPSTQPDTAERLAREIVDAAVEAVGGDATGVVESGLPWVDGPRRTIRLGCIHPRDDRALPRCRTAESAEEAWALPNAD